MRLSTRRSISRAAVLGLLSTTPLIAGLAAAGSDDERAPRASAGSSDRDHVDLAAGHRVAFRELDQAWLDAAPAVDDRLRDADELAGPGDIVPDEVSTTGLTAEDIAAIDTSGITVTVLRDERPPAYVAADGESITATRVHDFLDARNAPMAEQADAIVAAGIAHGVDPRVIVGIAIAESNAGERLPAGSHNAWGWGGSGRFGLAHWDSWDEALDTYTERLGALYDTDDVDRSFAETYCPPNWRWWLDTVTWAVGEI